MNKYKQIILSDRYTIYHERKQGKSCARLADIIGKHRCTVDSELRRENVLLMVTILLKKQCFSKKPDNRNTSS